jgi:monovalent cation/hydrogen antiporter
MENLQLVIILLAVITALAVLAEKIRLSYPILLVLAGIGIGLIPGLPQIQLSPEVIFLIFLPPILYYASWYTSWPDFKESRRPILLLALGCVLFTTCGVAIVAHYFIPSLSWPVAFLLGAIISPPDAVAATSVTKGLGVPRRVITILEGESLVNDATGLIAYRYAIAAVTTGSFVLWEASLQFLLVAGGGILIGLAVGWIIFWIHKLTGASPTVNTSLTFLTPYIVYLSAEEVHVSGVLAAVSCGLFLNWNSSEILTHKSRLQAVSVWDTVVFILNGIIFILIGLQLPYVLEGIKEEYTVGELVYYGVVVSLAVILFRIIWVYPGTYLPRLLSKKVRKKEAFPELSRVTVVAWTGMRGVVSLAAAMAVPLTIGNNVPFPHRNLVLFLTFCVILATLIIQGLSLPYLIKAMGIKNDGSAEKEETDAKLELALGAIEYIESNISYGVVTDEVLAQIKTKYEIRMQRLLGKQGKTDLRYDSEQLKQFHKIQEEILHHERKLLSQLRKEKRLNDEVIKRLEYELDLEESRLILDGE